MIGIFLTKAFNRKFRKARIPRKRFDEGIKSLLEGKADSLGHKLYKIRVASATKGKRGSYRTIAFCKKGQRVIFLGIYAKKDQENITKDEEKGFILLADLYNNLNTKLILTLTQKRELVEYDYQEPESNSKAERNQKR